MQTVDDWRSPETAGDFAGLDLAGFAQEFLRRNPAYCRDYHAIAHGHADPAKQPELIALATRWGLSFPVPARPPGRRRSGAMGARPVCVDRPARSRTR